MNIPAQADFKNILLVHTASNGSSPVRNTHSTAIDVEARIMEDFGHQVTRLAVRAVSPHDAPILTPVPTWSQQERENFAELMKIETFNIIHFHHTAPLFHSGIYVAARHSGKPVVQTLHVPLLQPTTDHNGRGQAVSDRYFQSESSENFPRNSAREISDFVDLFIVPFETMRTGLIDGGVDPHRIGVKPYALPKDPGAGNGRAGFALYVGPLDVESGVDLMLDSFSHAHATSAKTMSSAPLKIVGTGTLEDRCIAASRSNPHIQFVGSPSRARTIEMMKDASLLIMPVPNHLNFTLLEAMATGLPVLAIDQAGSYELIEPHITGVLSPPMEMAARAASLLADKPAVSALRKSTRARFLANHTPDRSRDVLLDLYRRATKIREKR